MSYSGEDPALYVATTLVLAFAKHKIKIGGRYPIDHEEAVRVIARAVADDLNRQFVMTRRPWSPGENYCPRS